jgi:hypothetical protein
MDGSRCPPVNGLASLFNALSGNLGAHRRDRPLLYAAGLQPVEIRCDLVCDGFRAKSIEGDGSAESQASERKFSRNRAGIFMTNHVPARREALQAGPMCSQNQVSFAPPRCTSRLFVCVA